jgi:predicted dinucleotide-binding enzyme
MKIAVLGTGIVGRTLAEGLARSGHDVTIGTRDPEATLARTDTDQMDNPPFGEWHREHGGISLAAFADAAADAEAVVNASSGEASLEVLGQAGAENLAGKVLIDVANPLDFSGGFPPTLSVSNTDSLGEQIQRAFPEARVVKTLNTVNAHVMIAPGSVAGGDHTVFVSGDDADAKATADSLLRELGWKDILDLGGIESARGAEMYLPMWLRMMGVLGTPMFSVKVVR